MTAFDHFQIATCQISEKDYGSAVSSLTAAFAEIDRTGVDAHMRDDLAGLLDAIEGKE